MCLFPEAEPALWVPSLTLSDWCLSPRFRLWCRWLPVASSCCGFLWLRSRLDFGSGASGFPWLPLALASRRSLSPRSPLRRQWLPVDFVQLFSALRPSFWNLQPFIYCGKVSQALWLVGRSPSHTHIRYIHGIPRTKPGCISADFFGRSPGHLSLELLGRSPGHTSSNVTFSLFGVDAGINR